MARNVPYITRNHEDLERMCIQLWREEHLANCTKRCSLLFMEYCLGEDVYSVAERRTAGKLCQRMFLILLEYMQPWRGCVFSCGEKNSCQIVPRNVPYFTGKHAALERMCIFSCGERNSWQTMPRNVPFITRNHAALERMCIQLWIEEQLANYAKECSFYY